MNSSNNMDVERKISETIDVLESIPSPSLEKKKKFLHFLKLKFFVFFLIIVILSTILLCIGLLINYEHDNNVILTIDAWKDKLSKEKQFWFDSGFQELKEALNVRQNTRRAKNVIVFIGDGMGPITTTAARIYKYKEEGLLSWEKFPHMGLLKTYCVDKQVPDSSSTATALFGGVKTLYEKSGVDSSVENCNGSLNEEHRVDSVIKWAQDVGMRTGFVTTTRIMHATPAGLYAHVPDRRWECEARMNDQDLANGCKDIARQLIEDEPGKNFNVIMGGGKQCLLSNVTDTANDPVDTWACYSTDGRNLIRDWANDKISRNVSYASIQNNDELRNLNTNTDFVLGVFANGHLPFEHNRDNSSAGMPSLGEMTIAAIKVLSNRDNGFILMVEGGMIDQAHHRGNARQALSEVSAFDDAIEKTLDLLKNEIDESLIIVTADHAHTLSINGYPDRGNSILGVSQNSRFDTIPYTTLSYATGHFGYQAEMDENGTIQRSNPAQYDTESYDYVQQVTIKTDENTHGGADVNIHAMGPFAHLFHRVHEQSYVAHVISFAARIGRFRERTALENIIKFFT